MPGSTPFRLNRSGLLLALISTAFAGQVQAAAGRVEFAIGPATVVGTDGRTRPAARGTELDTGDTVQTNNGRVQVRMTDGAYISLQPNTEFGIKNYKFAGKADGSENALYSLFKGAMRTVTGLIGRTNRNRYQVATPTATVGIRGTGGLIQVQNDGSTLVQGTSGIWFLANPAGTIDIPAGVAGIAPVDPKLPPKETLQIPTAGPSPLPALIEFVQGEERETDGENVIAAAPAPGETKLSGLAVVNAFGYAGPPSFPGIASGASAIAKFNAGGQMTEVTVNSTTFSLASGSHADFGTDSILTWGRWIGPVSIVGSWCEGTCSGTNYTQDQGLHYVVGVPTPSMPLTGTANYTLTGATQPTYIDGRTAPGTLTTGSLAVDFAGLTVITALDVAMPDTSYSIRGVSLISSGTAFFFGNAPGTLTCSGGSGCTARVDGFFAGASAERAGLGYHVRDSIGGDIVGAAAFQKQ